MAADFNQPLSRIRNSLHVEGAVVVGDVVRLFSFRNGQANLVERTLLDNSGYVGKTVEEVPLSENSKLAAIVREGRIIRAKPNNVFNKGYKP